MDIPLNKYIFRRITNNGIKKDKKYSETFFKFLYSSFVFNSLHIFMFYLFNKIFISS